MCAFSVRPPPVEKSVEARFALLTNIKSVAQMSQTRTIYPVNHLYARARILLTYTLLLTRSSVTVRVNIWPLPLPPTLALFSQAAV